MALTARSSALIIAPARERVASRPWESRLSISRFIPIAFGVVLALVAVTAPARAQSAARALPLAAPVLTPFNGKAHTDSYLVTGDVDSIRTDSWVRVLRNGVVIDSTAIVTRTSFSVRVPLVVGDNTLTAILRDKSFNTSPPSNSVIVNFVDKPGLFMPVPMVPGASFDLNAVETAVKAEVRIFDTTGDLVVRFESREARVFYSFPWDGKNGSFQSVRRGPLVAVATLDYVDGTHDVVRQVFLFDPKGAP